MKERNTQLKQAIGKMVDAETVKEIQNIPCHDAVNISGRPAYLHNDELRLLMLLNTLKLQPQYYRTETETIQEISKLVERIAIEDPYFVAQAVVWSRCIGDGMRSVNHLAAALLAPFASGQEWAKRFYSRWDKKAQKGGCIFRLDDMSEIKDVYAALNKGALSNAMKKGFASVIEQSDAYQLSKYRRTVIDIANLSHPDVNKSTAVINGDKVLKMIMEGKTVSADTWEVAQSEAGQEVAKAVREGRLTADKAEQVLTEAKSENWKQLLADKKLGILAAIRNIRNILKVAQTTDVIEMLRDLIGDPEAIRNGKVMPYQIDTAYHAVAESELQNMWKRALMTTLYKVYEASIPNLAAALPGKTCVLVDCSGSMHTPIIKAGCKERHMDTLASRKAGLIAATIAKAVNADIVQFGSTAQDLDYDPNTNVFELGSLIGKTNMGGTDIARAISFLESKSESYDRIIILSDYECNHGSCVKKAYEQYIRKHGSPYVYCIDLAAYGTTQFKNDGKVNYYVGFGYRMFDDIASSEFDPQKHIEEVRKVVI